MSKSTGSFCLALDDNLYSFRFQNVATFLLASVRHRHDAQLQNIHKFAATKDCFRKFRTNKPTRKCPSTDIRHSRARMPRFRGESLHSMILLEVVGTTKQQSPSIILSFLEIVECIAQKLARASCRLVTLMHTVTPTRTHTTHA